MLGVMFLLMKSRVKSRSKCTKLKQHHTQCVDDDNELLEVLAHVLSFSCLLFLSLIYSSLTKESYTHFQLFFKAQRFGCLRLHFDRFRVYHLLGLIQSRANANSSHCQMTPIFVLLPTNSKGTAMANIIKKPSVSTLLSNWSRQVR